MVLKRILNLKITLLWQMFNVLPLLYSDIKRFISNFHNFAYFYKLYLKYNCMHGCPRVIVTFYQYKKFGFIKHLVTAH